MNAKKHKSKHRGKVNPVPPQKQDKTEVAHGNDKELVTNNPVFFKSEESVENKEEIRELFTVLKDEENNVKKGVEEVTEESNNDTPVKPKRSKGKKKKQTELESDQDNKVDISKDGEIIKIIPEVNPNDIIIQEPCTIQPNAHKKKHKNIKHIDPSDEILTETKSDVEVDISKEGEIIKIIPEVNPNDTIIQEPFTIQPNAHKKKHKNKKHIEPSGEILTETKPDVEVSLPEQTLIIDTKGVENKGENKIEVNVTNKKNKKKKRKQESEKSDKFEEKISCTAALSEIIDKTNVSNDLEKDSLKDTQLMSKDDLSESENISTNLTNEEQTEQNMVNVDDKGTQKKKKKGKKHPHKFENEQPVSDNIQIKDGDKSGAETSHNIQMIEEDRQSLNEEYANKPTVLESCNDVIYSQNTPESRIEKINETCLVTRSDSNIVKNTVEYTNTMSPIDLVKDFKGQEVSGNFSEISEKLESSEEKTNIEKFSSRKVDVEMTKEECGESAIETENLKQKTDAVDKINKTHVDDNFDTILPIRKSEEIPILEKGIDKLDNFIKLGTAESEGKTSNIGSSTQNKNLLENSDKVTISNECCDCTPDFIHIPRSISQQILDNNNNNKMIIHEITSSDDVKLGLPVLTSDLIQGSGETPVSTPKIIPNTSISVTEIESSPSKGHERTDLKSKMIEVNQDLEELKMSLEKSLAELNAIEKGEDKFENKSNESFEQKTENANESVVNSPEEGNNVYKPLADRLNEIESKFTPKDTKIPKNTLEEQPIGDNVHVTPVCPSRRDRKGKSKSKKKGRIESEVSTTQTPSVPTETKSMESKNENKNEAKEKSKSSEEKGKQQAANENESVEPMSSELYFETIENFEDALTSSVDDVDVNKTFEIIAKELNNDTGKDQRQKESFLHNPEINITPPVEDTDKDREQKNVNPVSQPKNLLGDPNIPVSSNKTDYKKEKNKTPNSEQAKVKIKDAVGVESDNVSLKRSKQSQTDNRMKFLKDKNVIESFSYVTNEKEEYVYKYSFRKVFLASVCHICRKELKQTRLNCKFCNLVFYCSQKHKDEDWPRHQSLCFAVSTIVHLKDQKHIYANATNLSGDNYRWIRMQMIISCEKVLKRKLLPWEQEALLYPRICADARCREWKQSRLSDCEGCGQISFCTEHPEHLPSSHQRWCKTYVLYQKLVLYQQANGRLEPKLPSKVMVDNFVIPAKMNEVLASIYEEKIDMSDIQYAALTQLATAPLTAAHCHQTYRQVVNCSNGISKRSTFTVHCVGADLQFEADSLNKWEVFLLHLKPDVKFLRVALTGPDLNPSNLPLDLLSKINLCESCRKNKRRVQFSFQDKKSYHEFWSSDDFTVPDIVCAFNPSIQRASIYNGCEPWPSTINCIMKQKVPLLVTSHTLDELNRDLECIKDYTEAKYKVISEPEHNPFASVRPDRNFITDDEAPLLFKNYASAVLCGV